MANYYGNGRSNYVRVIDLEAFKYLCEERDFTFIDAEDGRVGCYTNDEGGYANNYSQDNECELPDFTEDISNILEDGEVFIWMHTGNEKMRYLNGDAFAVNNKGKTVSVGLNDIYKLAEALGTEITRAEY